MRYASAALLVCLLLWTVGCTTTTRPDLPADQVAALAAMVYPADAERGDDLDIVAVHRGDRVQLVNRTPHVYQDVVLWFNQQYVRPVERLAIGPDNIIDLRRAVNRHRQAYPVGSFLRPEKRLRLVQAELFDPTTGLRHRLTVQPVDDR